MVVLGVGGREVLTARANSTTLVAQFEVRGGGQGGHHFP